METDDNIRKMDMLNADLLLKKEATSKQKGQKRKTDEEDNEAGFHFIAFMPIEANLWKLDGLERQPICLGEHVPSLYLVRRSLRLVRQDLLKTIGLVRRSLILKPAWPNTEEIRSSSLS